MKRIELTYSTSKISSSVENPQASIIEYQKGFCCPLLNFSSGLSCVIRWGEEKRGEGCRCKTGFQIQKFHLRKVFCGLT